MCSRGRSIYWRRFKCKRSQSLITTSFPSRICGRSLVKTQNSRSTFPTSTLLAKALLASTSSTSLTPSTLTISNKWWAMPMSNVWRLPLRTCRISRSQSPNTGKRNWDRCHTYPVSLFLWSNKLIVSFKYREKWQNASSSEAKFQVD